MSTIDPGLPSLGRSVLWAADIRANFERAKNDIEQIQRDLAGGAVPDAVLQGIIQDLQTSVTALSARIDTANANLTAHNTAATAHSDIRTLLNTLPLPLTFVFAGVPAINSTINVPLTVNAAIGVLATSGSRYYNQVNPTGQSIFILYRIPLGGTAVEIGRATKPAGTGAAVFSGNGHSTLIAGDTLRMTASSVGGDLTDVSITIHATRRV